MDIKPGANFENPEFIYGSGPEIHHEDDEKGLILSPNRCEWTRGWIASLKPKSDNNLPKKPKKAPLSNFVTLEIIRAGGVDAIMKEDTPSVIYSLFEQYPRQKVLKIAYPKWRDTNESIKLHYYQKAARQIANRTNAKPYTMDILLSPKFGKEIIANGGCNYLYQRLEKKLNRELGRKPTMFFVLEAVKKERSIINEHTGREVIKGRISQLYGQLHAHGTIVLESDLENDICKKAIRELNASENRKFKNHEHRGEPIERNNNPNLDDLRRAEYCNKYQRLNKMFLNGLQRFVRSRELASVGRDIYEADRRRLKHG